MVKKGGLTARNERVKLQFGEGEGPHVLTCTCGFPARYKIPCCHALAVCRGEMTAGFVKCGGGGGVVGECARVWHMDLDIRRYSEKPDVEVSAAGSIDMDC